MDVGVLGILTSILELQPGVSTVEHHRVHFNIDGHLSVIKGLIGE